jgi:hypothetical protein
MGRSIGYGPCFMKQILLVQISSPPSFSGGFTWGDMGQTPQVKKKLKKFMNSVFKFWFAAPLVFFDDSLTTETFSVHCLLLFLSLYLFLSHSRLTMLLRLEEKAKREGRRRYCGVERRKKKNKRRRREK